MDANGFTIVKGRSKCKGKGSRRSGGSQRRFKVVDDIETSYAGRSDSYYLELIKSVKTELKCSELWKDFEIQYQSTGTPSRHIAKIVCYGLGSITNSISARYQLAFLLLLNEMVEPTHAVEVYDPIFNKQEKDILGQLDCKVLAENTEGENRAETKTLFYLPHCSHHLANNLLYSNWSIENLRNCIIVSNSFQSIRDGIATEIFHKEHAYISKAVEVSVEYPITHTYDFAGAFNSLAIILFNYDKLNKLSADKWLENNRPQYDQADLILKNSE